MTALVKFMLAGFLESTDNSSIDLRIINYQYYDITAASVVSSHPYWSNQLLVRGWKVNSTSFETPADD